MPSEHLLRILSCGSFAIYLALQAYAIIKWQGWWRWLAMPPVVILGCLCAICLLQRIFLGPDPMKWPVSMVFLAYLLPIAVLKWLTRGSFKSSPRLVQVGAILVVVNLFLAWVSCYQSIKPKKWATGMHLGPFYHELECCRDDDGYCLVCKDARVEKSRIVIQLRNNFKTAYGTGIKLDDYVLQDDYKTNAYGFSLNLQRDKDEFIVNGKRLKEGEAYKEAVWPRWSLWYAQVEEFFVKNDGLVARAWVWDDEASFHQRHEIPPSQKLKTDILYIRGGHYWQWRLSWRGPALLVASLLLMLYGRRRLPKKLPAISES